MSTMEFRPARAEEWEQARDLRLEMLADTPIAYLQTWDDAAATPDEVWRRQRAIRFYERTGWRLTGRRRPYPLDPTMDELEMRKAL